MHSFIMQVFVCQDVKWHFTDAGETFWPDVLVDGISKSCECRRE